jgi:hypothetical protein
LKRNTSLPSSGSKNTPSKKLAWRQVASGSVDFQRTIWRYIPEDSTLQYQPGLWSEK